MRHWKPAGRSRNPVNHETLNFQGCVTQVIFSPAYRIQAPDEPSIYDKRTGSRGRSPHQLHLSNKPSTPNFRPAGPQPSALSFYLRRVKVS
jgi:hypothetical protein